MKRIIVLLLIAWGYCSLGLSAQTGGQRLAIGDIRWQGEEARLLAVRMGSLLETELLKIPDIQVVERKEKAQIFEEQKLQQTGITDLSTAVEIGRNLNVEKIIFGSVEIAAGVVHLNLKAARVDNSQLVFSESAEADRQNIREIKNAYISLVERLLAAISGRQISISNRPGRLIVTLEEGIIHNQVKMPKGATVMAIIRINENILDSAVVARGVGWSRWDVQFYIPDYDAEAVDLEFYIKGKGIRQRLGNYRFNELRSGAYPIGEGETFTKGRFKIQFQEE